MGVRYRHIDTAKMTHSPKEGYRLWGHVSRLIKIEVRTKSFV